MILLFSAKTRESFEHGQSFILKNDQLRNLSETPVLSNSKSNQTERPPRPDEEINDRPPRPNEETSDGPPRPDEESSDRPPRPNEETSDGPPRPNEETSDGSPRPDEETSDRPPRPDEESDTDSSGKNNKPDINKGSDITDDSTKDNSVFEIIDIHDGKQNDSAFEIETSAEIHPLMSRKYRYTSLLDKTDFKFKGILEGDLMIELSYKEKNDEIKSFNSTIAESATINGIEAESIDLILYNLSERFVANLEVSVTSSPVTFIIAGINGFLFIILAIVLFLLLGGIAFKAITVARKRAKERRNGHKGNKKEENVETSEFKITNSLKEPVESIKYPSMKTDSRATPDDHALVVSEVNDNKGDGGGGGMVYKYNPIEVQEITRENLYPFFTEQTTKKMTIKSEIIIKSEKTIRSKSFEPINPHFMTRNKPKSTKNQSKKLLQLNLC